MSIKVQYQTQFAYLWHTTTRLMDCAAKLEESVYYENAEYGRGSIHSLLLHLWGTPHGYRRGLETGLFDWSPDDFPTLTALRTGFEQEKTAWDVFLEGLSETKIMGEITIVFSSGDRIVPLWSLLQHIVLHGMQHHAELAQLLTEKGQSPGNIDFIFFDPLARWD